jgi:hypothetical protein
MVPLLVAVVAVVLALLALTLHPMSGVMVGPGLVHLSLVRLLAGQVVVVGEETPPLEHQPMVAVRVELPERLVTEP